MGCPTSLLTPPAGEDIAKETAKEWKGLRVTVKLTVQNRVAKVGTAVCITNVCRA
jgi:ribosomal protein L11